MHVKQLKLKGDLWQVHQLDEGFDNESCQLVIAFGARHIIEKDDLYGYLRQEFPSADIISASTAGEILGDLVEDDTVAVTGICFGKTSIKSVISSGIKDASSFEVGDSLMKQLIADNLAAVFVLSDGSYINGSELVAGFNNVNTKCVPVTGGLAGDGSAFKHTVTGLNCVPAEGNVVAVGLYGNSLKVGHGSVGGWDEFGHERTITGSSKNILLELDGRNALDIYKDYLGDYVNELPGSALLFPISLRKPGQDGALVRTILAVDEEFKTMTFAGNMPVGSKVRLMKANFDRLIDGSACAASNSINSIINTTPQLAILISCVGRKLVLQHRIDEEVEAAREILGTQVPVTGFYSYGELSPLNPSTRCELHNQTMTITTLTEI